MTGNEKPENATPGKPGGSNVLLYSLIALFAAIAGFLTISLVDRFGGGPSASVATQPVRTAAAESGAAKGSSGLEKLVRADQPKPLPEVTFGDGEGTARALSEWKGKVVLLNLWATWCAPCKVEMPGLDRLQAKLGGPDFTVVPISLDWSGAEKPRQFLKDNDLGNLGLYLDTSKSIMQHFNAPGLPLTVLIDREGREVARLAGAAEWDSAEAETLIREIMDKDGGN